MAEERPEETLRRAAKQIRVEHGPPGFPWTKDLDAAWLAVADWMEATAHDIEHVHDPIYVLTSTTINRAVKAGKAFLAEI